MDKLQLDRRLLACVMTFGLVTTYMYLPVGFGRIYLEDILLGQISRQGLDVSGVNVLIGLVAFVSTGVGRWTEADAVFSGGMRMLAMIGLIMIAAQGFAEVMNRTGHIEPLVQTAVSAFGNSRALAALSMLVVGLIVTMGIGSSFSTLPIIVAIYVPLCVELGFSPLATVALVGTAGALGDAGSPASDPALGPTAGLNVDGKHDHMRGTVIPTFLHFNLPLLATGWVAALVL